MTLLIDGDGCPVAGYAVAIAKKHRVPCVIFCDTAHEMEYDGAETVTVSKGADSADYALVSRIKPGDVAITQDYGLAAMCLAKNALVINQDGRIYTEENILGLLTVRQESGRLRRSGVRMKGPKKRTEEQNRHFCLALEKILSADT